MRSILIITILLASTGESARILVLQPTPARGHTIVTEPLWETLAARGHHLTLVTSFPHSPPLPRLREIDVSAQTDVNKWVGNLTVDFIKENQPNQFSSAWFMADASLGTCTKAYSNDKVRELLSSNDRYDMVITEIFIHDCFVPFAAKFGAPLVSVVTSYALPWTADRVGLPDNPAYIPNYYMDFGSKMNLWERAYNTMFLIFSKLLYYYKIVPTTQQLVDEYFEDGIPPVVEIVQNTSLVLVNSYFSVTSSRPLPPNVIEVGGIHIRNTTQKVPKDLQHILDSSINGVLVVSFGSMVRMASLDKKIIKTFLTSFSKIPQTVIFKYEEELAEVPKNVVVKKWLPQQKIIEHKNVRAVLIHGGLASTIEAIHFGKPMIGVPFFSDQFLNIKTVTRLGAGVLLDLDDISDQTLDSALGQVLNDPKYAARARQLSEQFRDRPSPPLSTAVWWVEYVLRHGGAPQLRSAAVDLPMGRYLLLDVAAGLLAALYLAYAASSRLLRALCKRAVGQKDKDV